MRYDRDPRGGHIAAAWGTLIMDAAATFAVAFVWATAILLPIGLVVGSIWATRNDPKA